MKNKPARRRNGFRVAKEVRKLARERIGSVRPGQIVEPKGKNKSPRHPKREMERDLEA